jgi:hypothetical protein
MLQNNYDINLVETYLNAHPNPKNKDLYIFCNATTNSQKQCVRRKKLRLQNEMHIHPDTDTVGLLVNQMVKDSKSKHLLTEEYIERKIYDGLEANPGNIQLIGKATEFFIKVKGKTNEIEDDIDMEALKEIGINIKSSN